MKLPAAILFPVLMSVVLTGCFTGVESTPKITADDVKRENVTVTAEQEFLSDIRAEQYGKWSQGKEFHVTDDKITLIFGASSQDYGENLGGKELCYMDSRQVMSVTGSNATEMTFVSTAGNKYVYRVDCTAEELCRREAVEIPFTIEMSLVRTVRERLMGRKLYILTPVWYDENDAVMTGRKFVPVTVTDVSPGNTVYPVKVTFIDEVGGKHGVFMSVGKNANVPRMFHSLFAFEDPHKKYPNISDETWDNIVNGRVAPDMTRDECRLSLGVPKSVDRRPGYGGVQELWIYEDGIYLMFEDGLLRNFRK
ncbi:MAG: hypothetical protein IJY31_02950 [Muribaculaceae bacterium]|nr:hypothetical protein [Muribaculaceae bacterium]